MTFPLRFESPLALIKGREHHSKLLAPQSSLCLHIQAVRKVLQLAFPSQPFDFRPPSIQLLHQQRGDASLRWDEVNNLVSVQSKLLEGVPVQTDREGLYKALGGGERFSLLVEQPQHALEITIATFAETMTSEELRLCRGFAIHPHISLTATEQAFVASYQAKSSTSLTQSEQQALLFGVDLHTTVTGFPLFTLQLLSSHCMLPIEEENLCKLLDPKSLFYQHIIGGLIRSGETLPVDYRLVADLDDLAALIDPLEQHRAMEFSVYSDSLHGQVIDVSELSRYEVHSNMVWMYVGTPKQMTSRCLIKLTAFDTKKETATQALTRIRAAFCQPVA